MQKSILLLSFFFVFSALHAQPTVMSFDEYNLKFGEHTAERLVSTDMIRLEEAGKIAKMKVFVLTNYLRKEMEFYNFFDEFEGNLSIWTFIQKDESNSPGMVLFKPRKIDYGNGRIDYTPVIFTEAQRSKLTGIYTSALKNLDFGEILWGDQIISMGISNRVNGQKTPEMASIFLAGLPDTTSKIDLTKYKLREVPKELYRFKKLKELDLSDNLIQDIPAKLWRRRSLKSLNLSHNMLMDEGLRFRRNKGLKTLNIQYNRFTKLPKGFYKLKSVDDFFAGNNFLIDFDEQKFKKKSSIKNLNLYNAAISSLPQQMIRLKNLQELDLYYNNLRTIDLDFAQFPKLKTLALSFNGLWKLPQGVEQLNQLEKVYAHHNKIKNLPELSSTVKLLDMGYNLFEELPEPVFQLTNLEETDFSNCRLNQMPEQLTTLPALKSVFITGNPFEDDKAELKKLEEFTVAMQKRAALVR